MIKTSHNLQPRLFLASKRKLFISFILTINNNYIFGTSCNNLERSCSSCKWHTLKNYLDLNLFVTFKFLLFPINQVWQNKNDSICEMFRNWYFSYYAGSRTITTEENCPSNNCLPENCPQDDWLLKNCPGGQFLPPLEKLTPGRLSPTIKFPRK